MDAKFMKIKRIIIPVITAVMMMSQLAGCALMSSSEMIDMIDQGQSIVLEVNEPSTYTISVKGEQKDEIEWVQLDQLKTFNTGFRQGVDEVFNINIITDNNTGAKYGCLYVVNVNGQEMRSGNTTIADAFRNKRFIQGYYSDSAVKTKLSELAEKAYTDIDANSKYGLQATFNAYYNLLNDAENPDAFNPTQSVTREEFYTMLYKSTHGVSNINIGESDAFAMAMGETTEYTKYAKQVADLGFLSYKNKSLDGENIGNSISRIEAIYMIVRQNFDDLYQKATSKNNAFTDTKSAGDLALKLGFKEEVTKERVNEKTGKNEKYKDIVEKDMWQLYTLDHMLKNPDDGLQDELYRAMAVAKAVGIIKEAESRWDEVLSKSEAIDLIINTQLAKNELYGFATELEYAEMEAPSNLQTSNNSGNTQNSLGNLGIDTNSQIASESSITLDDLLPSQLTLFELTLDFGPSHFDGLDELENYHKDVIDTFIKNGDLPMNSQKLFREYKDKIAYYDREDVKGLPEIAATEVDIAVNNQAETPIVQYNKPVPSEQQVQQQISNVQNNESSANGSQNSGYDMLKDPNANIKGTIWDPELGQWVIDYDLAGGGESYGTRDEVIAPSYTSEEWDEIMRKNPNEQ